MTWVPKLASPVATAAPRVAGVVLVLNRDIIPDQEVTFEEIMPGRAIQADIQWHSTLVTTILNIYALNAPHENRDFWAKLNEVYKQPERKIKKPELMLGDFNLVEDAINQLLCNKNTVEELQKLKHKIKVQDGWRTMYPNSKAYTHTQKPAMSRARLDWIYATEVIIRTALEWDRKTRHRH